MIERKSGVILHISSIQHRLPLYDATLAYAAAKGALNTYNKGLANEVGPKGVRVNMISPGFIETSGALGMIVQLAQSSGISEDTARRQNHEYDRKAFPSPTRSTGGSRRTSGIPSIRSCSFDSRRGLRDRWRHYAYRLITYFVIAV